MSVSLYLPREMKCTSRAIHSRIFLITEVRLADNARRFTSTQSIEIQTLQENSRDDATAVVTVSFMEVDAENHSHEWKRRVSLVKEGDAWRIDRTQSTTP